MTFNFVTAIPWAFWMLLATMVVVFGIVVSYALRIKGDVCTELTHGKTSFKLEAKERSPKADNKEVLDPAGSH
jgi:hypothetical protein